MARNYNTTDLDPAAAFERHVYHRDQFAHYLRWTHILKEAKIGDRVVDFGCGKGSLLEVFYRNKFKCERYTGLDIRKQTIEANKEKFANVEWAEFIADDLVKPVTDLTQFQANRVCSFEVAEHVGKQNVPAFLQGFKACGAPDATYYLSTPNFDTHVGAAGNHTFDSGDGRGVAPQELGHEELGELIAQTGFRVVAKYGTFASMRDYKPLMNDCQAWMFDRLREYYDSNLVSNIMAPFFPEVARNCLWVLQAS